MRLEGEFVTLRPLEVDDAARTLAWRLGARAQHLQEGAQTEDAQRAWIAAHSAAAGELNFIIECRGVPVGMVALLEINRQNRSAVMGRLLIGEQEAAAGAPVFYEAELLLCDYAFDALKLHKLYGEIMEDNTGMVRTRQYLGYHQDGVLRDHYFARGSFHNAVAVSLLEDEYRRVCRPKLMQLAAICKGTP